MNTDFEQENAEDAEIMKTETKLNEQELRELDAWIAEHVFGWVMLWRTHGGKPLKAIFPSSEHAKVYGFDWQPVTKQNNPREFFVDWQRAIERYTTDPAAAMQVLEKCIVEQRKLHAGDACFFISKDGGDFWLRTVVNNQHLDGQSKSLPLAICLFAKQLFSE